jgi:hypothetical protein
MIDPELRAKYGPEVCWVWRSLLTGAGLPWEEVHPGCPSCDIVYFQNPPGQVDFKLHIKADLQKWDKNNQLRIIGFGEDNHFIFPQYSGENVRPPIWFLKNRSVYCSTDIVFDYYWIVSGKEERYWPYNKHGIFDLSMHDECRVQILLNAITSGISTRLEERLSNLGFRHGIPRWPANKRAAFCATHDVDCPEAGLLLGPMVLIKRRGLRSLKLLPEFITGRRSFWHFASWLKAEKEFNLHSAFYFCAKKGSFIKYARGVPDPFYDIRTEKFIRLLKLLVGQGVEIGLHASYLAGTGKEIMLSEKQQLEECCGVKVEGNRHHYWHLDPIDPDSTLSLHEEVGFKYDLSLSHDRYAGWRRGNARPFFPFHGKKRKQLGTLQISTGWMDNQLFGCLQENGGDRQTVIQDLIDQTLSHGGCLIVDIHDYVFDDLCFPGWAKTYWELVRRVVENSDFWIATPAQVSDHWRKRYDGIVERSRGLADGMP